MTSEAEPEAGAGIDTNNDAGTEFGNHANLDDTSNTAHGPEPDPQTAETEQNDPVNPEPENGQAQEDQESTNDANANPEPEPENAEPATAQPQNASANEAEPDAPVPVPEPEPPAAANAAPTPTQDPKLDKHVPLIYWLMVGGTGPPPKLRSFQRMTRERNAAGRAKEDRAAARKQALEERSKYLAEWEKQWGPVGAAGLVAKLFGGNRRKRG
ncbi:hypothetical protein GGR54DRAFT_649408 [Hypoxylon sp. NC1633]|nr:hypothetical protein GGR54DRAFT_649408 [Hypoxylon sp. NC1633]